MALLVIDLDKTADLHFALEEVQRRLSQLESPDEPGIEPGLSSHDQGVDPDEVAKSLLGRLRADETIDFVRAMAFYPGDEFSLRDIADQMGVDYGVVKARKFRFGRTEAQLDKEFAIKPLLLKSHWQGDRNVYSFVSTDIRDAIRARLTD